MSLVPLRRLQLNMRLHLCVSAAALLSLLLTFTQACAQPEDALPARAFLRIDPGMHTAPITAIAAPADCSFVATASTDKSIRLWEFGARTSFATLRPPSGDQNFGKLYALAVDPTGTWLAMGGWTINRANHFVFVMNLKTREITARFGPYQSIQALAISDDGQVLAAGLANGGGILAWRQLDGKWQKVLERKAPTRVDMRALAFDAEGALYSAASDGTIARFPEGFATQPRVVRGTGGKLPQSLAFNRVKKRLAVGYADTAKVDVLNASLSVLYQADGGGSGNGNLAAVAWSSDGATLYAGGKGGTTQAQLNLFANEDRTPGRVLSASSDTITALHACARGLTVTAADPYVGFFSSDGGAIASVGPAGPDMRGKVRNGLLVSDDGLRVRFGLGQGASDAIEFDLRTGNLKPSTDIREDLRPAATSTLPVARWENEKGPLLNDEALGALAETPWLAEERSRSLAIAPDRSLVVLGTDNYLRAFRADGSIAWTQYAPAVAWGVNVPAQGKLVVAAFADGTLRWYSLETGEELLALFVSRVDKRWIVWMPNGFYYCSIAGEELVGWHVNNGWSTGADFYPLQRFRDRYYDPAIVIKAALIGDVKKLIGSTPGIGDEAQEAGAITQARPAQLAILSPKPGAPHLPPSVKLELDLKASRGRAIDRIEVYEGQTRYLTAAVPAAAQASGRFQVTANFPPRDLRLRVVPYAGNQAGDEVRLDMKFGQLVASGDDGPKRLLGLLIGVNKNDPKLLESLNLKPLKHASEDAKKLKDELEAQRGGAFEQVDLQVLEDPTTTQIRDALDEVAQKAKPEDLVLISFSGHGYAYENQELFFLTASARRDLWASAFSGRELIFKMAEMPGQKLILLDACRSGDAAEIFKPIFDKFANDWRSRQGTVFFASTAPGKASYETDAYGGLFTYALIDGLRNAAAYPRGATTFELERHVRLLLANLNVDQLPIRVPSSADLDFVLAKGAR